MSFALGLAWGVILAVVGIGGLWLLGSAAREAELRNAEEEIWRDGYEHGWRERGSVLRPRAGLESEEVGHE